MAQDRAPAFFIGDSAGLDFLNSIATPVDVPVDWIDSGEGLLSWLEQARLVPQVHIDEMRRQALPDELDAVAEKARSLREWFRGFVHDHIGRPLSSQAVGALEPLNRLLERDEAYSRLVPADHTANHIKGTSLVLNRMRRWRSPETLLLPIAEQLALLVCHEDFSNIKACEGLACTLYFADHTRGHARRWCTMAVCGNRAKQAKHRERAKTLER